MEFELKLLKQLLKVDFEEWGGPFHLIFHVCDKTSKQKAKQLTKTNKRDCHFLLGHTNYIYSCRRLTMRQLREEITIQKRMKTIDNEVEILGNTNDEKTSSLRFDNIAKCNLRGGKKHNTSTK